MKKLLTKRFWLTNLQGQEVSKKTQIFSLLMLIALVLG